MKTRFVFTKKLMSILLCITLVMSYVPMAMLTNAAQSVAAIDDAFGGTDNKISDPWTVNDWKVFFNSDNNNKLDTTYAGGVWTDKSVFNKVQDYINATDEVEKSDFGLTLNDSNNFLVALSAIASTKSVEGYSALPSDTILVLDLSASMKTNQAVDALISSANNAIEKLQELNAYNRVGVVAYSGNSSNGFSSTNTASVILPLGRYTAGLDSNNKKAYLVSNWSVTTGSGRNKRVTNYEGVKVANGVTGTIADGVTSKFSTDNSKVVAGGTYIQNGLYKAWQMFSEVKDTRIENGLQAGTDRVPIMVLLSDGAPTTATNNYTQIDTSNNGDGTNSYATAGTAFLTQLTASWVRDNMEGKYGTGPLFYTLGLNVGSNASAKNVLDPSNNTDTDSYWTTFTGLKDKTKKTMNVLIRDYKDDDDNETTTVTYTAPVNEDGWSEDYVTEYFPASNAEGLVNAFGDIVEQIIIQSLYYPTMVESGNSINHDGFLHFEDYIGKNMEVKSVKGIQLGDTLYTGETLAKMIYQGGMGTVDNPTDAGNNLVWSVQSRLGLDTVAKARELIGLAYANGQLYYNPDTGEYSNYIGWYADVTGKFVGFWDGKDASPEAVPDNLKNTAVFAIKSYGYYDAVGEGHRKTDMMYATIQVRTTVANPANKTDASEIGDVRVIGSLPAALIPLVEYDVKLNGTDPMNPSSLTVNGADAPSRLLYEVGLNSKIDLLDIAGTAPDALTTDNDGNYVFYTNQWHNAGNFLYSTNKNTLTYFEPSIENERYYYSYDTPIYSDKNGTLYKGDSAPVYSAINPYYHRTLTYTKENDTVKAVWTYEQVSEYVLNDVTDLEKKADNSWVIKRGTIHHYFGDYEMQKTNNATGTFGYSDQPFVHEPEVGATLGYHIDSYLGNNGKLVIDPQEGIKITKVVDSTITDKSRDYTFTLKTDDSFNATVTLIKQNAEGERNESTVAFANGVATVTLKHGEAAWILGKALVGKSITVEEAKGDNYTVASVNGNTSATTANITVAANSIGIAAFVNTEQLSGDVIISKTVVSNFDSHQSKDFEFTVLLSGAMLKNGDTYNAVRSDGHTYTLTVGADNTIALRHGQYITIGKLPEGTTVTATEADYTSQGFTANSATLSDTVVIDETKHIEFVNSYDAKDTVIPTNISVKGIKDFDSDTVWNDDITFSFRLQKLNTETNEYENIKKYSVGSVVYNKETGIKNFEFNMDNEVYTKAGTYSYRVVELVNLTHLLNGIIYDTTPCYFDVIVTDDGLGQLYISDVAEGVDTVVGSRTESGVKHWDVITKFTNKYSVNGAAEAIINIDKLISSESGVYIPSSGFKFELYNADKDWNTDTLATTSYATSAGGKTDISLVYDDPVNDIGTHYYVLKELIPAENDRAKGVTYSQEKYGFKVTVGHLTSNYTIEMVAYKLSDGNATQIGVYSSNEGDSIAVAGIKSGITFTNTYVSEPVTLKPAISGTKTLNGRAQNNKEFSFNLYETDSSFNTEDLTPVDTQYAPATADGVAANFTFKDLVYNKVGTHYYVVKEALPQGLDAENKLSGVIYDTSEYHITVTISGDNTTGLLSAVSLITKNGYVDDITFENKYVTKPVTDIVIGGSKKLDGSIRKLQARAYSFKLVDSEGNTVRTAENGIPTDAYNATFAFEPLSFDAPGVYEYTISEWIPTEANASNNYTVHGLQYDTSSYKVRVEVTDNGDGTLSADVTYPDGAAAFVNHYKVSPTSITFSGKKNLTGDAIAKYTGEKAFRFELYSAIWDITVKDVVQDSLLATVSNNDDGSFSFTPDAVRALNFSTIGAYRFIIKELIPANADALMNYDVSVYNIEVDVTDDMKGGLIATPKIVKSNSKGEKTTVNDIEFNNVLSAEPIFVPITGKKNYNINLPADKFTFELYQARKDSKGEINAIGNPVLEATNDADGGFKFEEILLRDELSGTEVMTSYLTFETAGTYYFVVKEQLPDGVDKNNTLNGITYDTNEYKITVTINESTDATGRKTLNYQTVIEGAGNAVVFNNSYNASAENGVIISGSKTLNGKTLKDGDFTFGLYNATVKADGTVVCEADPAETKTNTDGKFTFSEIKYTKLADAKQHYYIVKEIMPEGVDSKNTLDGITYDSTAYIISVEVTDNGDGTLKVGTPVYKLIGEDGKVADSVVESISFVNNYKPAEEEKKPEEGGSNPPATDNNTSIEEVPSSPQTGDNSNLFMWLAVMFVSGTGLFTTIALSKKSRKTEE